MLRCYPPNQSVANQKAQAQLLYFSENLFDSDNQIEFMYTSYWVPQPPGQPYVVTQIVNQDGSILFNANDEYPWVRPTFHNQFYPIYNTANGTKMILSKADGSAKVYSLAGTYTGILANNHYNADELMALSPNPAGKNSAVRLSYELPQGISSAELKILDAGGKEIKSYRIGNDTNEILVEPGELSVGVYYYSILSGGKVVGTKKSVVIQ